MNAHIDTLDLTPHIRPPIVEHTIYMKLNVALQVLVYFGYTKVKVPPPPVDNPFGNP
jgi:hypothetical protein